MATRVLSTRMAIGGESEYKRALTEINSTLKTLRSELALVDSQYRANDKSIEALTAKANVLARTLDTQRAKLQQIQAGLKNAQAAQSSWAAKVDEARSKLTAAEAEMEKYRLEPVRLEKVRRNWPASSRLIRQSSNRHRPASRPLPAG